MALRNSATPSSTVGRSRRWRQLEELVRKAGSRFGLSRALSERLVELTLGYPNSEIAKLHSISENTVKTQVRELLQGLGLRCRHEIESAAEEALWTLNEEGKDEEHAMEVLLARLRPKWRMPKSPHG